MHPEILKEGVGGGGGGGIVGKTQVFHRDNTFTLFVFLLKEGSSICQRGRGRWGIYLPHLPPHNIHS